ncbi:MAG: hypothetical protein NVSMB27_14290 [Ktedonobacteraceae bacterium]
MQSVFVRSIAPSADKFMRKITHFCIYYIEWAVFGCPLDRIDAEMGKIAHVYRGIDRYAFNRTVKYLALATQMSSTRLEDY